MTRDDTDPKAKRAAEFPRDSPSAPNALRNDAAESLVGSTLVSGRLEVLSRIGAGGAGVVYAAFDRERACRVALKTLPWLEGDAIYALKNEFRQLADVLHPNLVRMFELFGDDERWFFTMELIDGEPFDAWVRPEQLDLTRLRSALGQLVTAVSAIHALGKLHRDLKPSNVLVTPEGRVVVLDFGLLIDSELGGVGRTVPEFRIDGTPTYMAPEQAAGQPATRASDFYAIGVMLFQALTGRLPFEGRPGAVIAAKQFRAAVSPAMLQPDLPADLVELCEQLLERKPDARPPLASIAARTQRPSAPPRIPGGRAADLPALHGREQPLSLLQRAFAAASSGTPNCVFIRGESGIGKTALCETFARELIERKQAVALRSRCYERESVPFKALDPLVDALSRHLRRLPPHEAAAILPREVFALAKLFPALDRIAQVAALPGTTIADPQELRSRAFAALGEWLARIRVQQPVLVYIDDLHWACAGSIAGLSQLLADRRIAPLLIVMTSRFDFDNLLEVARDNPALGVHQLTLDALDAPAQRALIAELVSSSPPDPHSVATIASESRGNPFLIQELARFSDQPVTLSNLLSARLSELSDSERTLLETLAWVGEPLPADVLQELSADAAADLQRLSAARLVRTSVQHRWRGAQAVQTYHNRIREAVAASLSDARGAEISASLVRVLSGRAEIDHELLSRCSELAGNRVAAARHAREAGRQAQRALAFERAAGLFDAALSLGEWASPELAELTRELGHALECAGRSAEAAEAYRRAASSSDESVALELERRAAELSTAKR